MRGTDVYGASLDFASNFTLKSNFLHGYTLGPNFLFIYLLFVLFYGAFMYFYCTAVHSDIDYYVDDFCYSFNRVGPEFSDIYSLNSVDLATFYRRDFINSLQYYEDVEEDLDPDYADDSFSGDMANPNDLSVYLEDYIYNEMNLFNNFRQCGTLPPPSSGLSDKPICSVSNPDTWPLFFGKGRKVKGRNTPKVNGPRLRTVVGLKVEELENMKHFHEFYNRRVFSPMDHMGDAPLTWKQYVEDAKSDPFLLPDLEPPQITKETLSELSEIVESEAEAWDPEDHVDEPLHDEIHAEVETDERYKQLLPYDQIATPIVLNEGNTLIPILDTPRVSSSHEDEQGKNLVFVEPRFESVFDEVLDEDSLQSNYEEVPVYSNLSHNFDHGVAIPWDISFGLSSHVYIGDQEEEIENSTLLYGDPASQQRVSSDVSTLFLNRGFYSVFPSREVPFCVDVFNLKHDILSELFALDKQLQSLVELSSKGTLPEKTGFTLLPLEWDSKKCLWVVFNYNSNMWVALSDFIGWASKRLCYLREEVFSLSGSNTSLIQDIQPYAFGAVLLTRIKLGVDWVFSFLIPPRIFKIIFSFSWFRGLFLFFDVAHSTFLWPRTPQSYGVANWSPQFIPQKMAEYSILANAKESTMSTSFYGHYSDDDPFRGYEDSPMYPYWFRLGLFNTADYLEAVDNFNPVCPTWVTNSFELSVEDFAPSLPLSDYQLVNSYYNGTTLELKRIYRTFTTSTAYIPSYEQESRLVAYLDDSALTTTFPHEHPLRQQARSFSSLSFGKAVINIAGYHFDDYSTFRVVTQSRVKDLMKHQIFPSDHWVNRDLMAKVTEEQRKRDTTKAAKLRIRISKMISEDKFSLVGRLETRLIVPQDHKSYLRLKYVEAPPKNVPARRKIFRRF